jgi:hypothetical protein
MTSRVVDNRCSTAVLVTPPEAERFRPVDRIVGGVGGAGRP